MEEKKRELLKMLAEQLSDSDDIDRAEFFTKEELEAPVDITRVIITDIGAELISVLGEFYFLPLEDEEMLFFACGITVTDDIEDHEKTDLYSAVARINYLLPFGSFAMDEGGDNVVYRYTVPVLADSDDDTIRKIMLTSVDAAVSMVDRFESYLMLVQEGNVTPDEMIKAIKGNADSSEA